MPGKITMTENEVRGLQTQINLMGSRMDKNFEELKESINAIGGKVHEMEVREASCYPSINQKVDAAWRKLEEHAVEIRALKEVVNTLKSTNRILTWILGIGTTVLTAYVVSLVVGG